MEGYKQGVLYINPAVPISEDFITQSPDLSGFCNPAAGYKHATAAFESGIDILYVAAEFGKISQLRELAKELAVTPALSIAFTAQFRKHLESYELTEIVELLQKTETT